MNNIVEGRQPFPPFTKETAAEKVRAAENGWNGRDADKVALAYTPDSVWRNRDVFINGRQEIIEFLQQKWQMEQEYRLIKELWTHDGNRIAVRFAYEWKNTESQWFRSYGNENWEFNAEGLMQSRYACINDLAITEDERMFYWTQGPRPLEHQSLSELGL